MSNDSRRISWVGQEPSKLPPEFGTNADWRRRYKHLAMRRQKSIAKVAMARKLGVRLYWMWRNGLDYSRLVEFGSHGKARYRTWREATGR